MERSVERRKAARVRHEHPVGYTALGVIARRVESVAVTGQGVDRSVDDGGIGFRSQSPLFTGQLLGMTKDTKDDGPRTAVVRWVSSAAVGYRAGAMIV